MPRGSNRFEFAQANSVVLIDEFDQTFNDVLPFWALPPSIIANRSQTIQADPNAITLKIINGKVEVSGTFTSHPRALDQSGLMKRWAKYVDDVNITMSGHDGPSIMMDWETRQKHIDAAKAGKREFATALQNLRDFGFPDQLFFHSSDSGGGGWHQRRCGVSVSSVAQNG